VFVQYGHFVDKGGVLQMKPSALFCAKFFGFFEIYGCPHGQGGWASADILRTRGEGFDFFEFWRTSFIHGPMP